ncbi:MAG TPA: peptidyl-alpha-hydroxyglycine alpha-amidating lyase family protein [Rhizomicrobium sp.]|nr:peptidyl-alpha-hydroxyglycine alpha-amidating lyase family protein [Rhizomicrobium sp.]
MSRITTAAITLCAAMAAPIAAWGQMPMPKPMPPDPFGPPERHWAHLPDGRTWGQSAGIEIGPHGEIWVIDRCAANSCDGSALPAVHQLDPKTGRPIRSIGAGLFAFPHGLHVDKDGNVWVTDAAVSKDKTKGEQVIKLSPDGKILMRLGTAGVSGGGPTHFHDPGDVVTAPNGDIFVADGHGTVAPDLPTDTITRIIKFSAGGKFIKAWGSLGSGKSQFRNPHALAFDSEGRLLVADRVNGRIQIFDQDGKWLTEYHGFNHPSGLYIDRSDTLYASDYNSDGQKGIYIGSARTGKLKYFVPDDQAGEGVALGPDGTLYAATPGGITRFLPKTAQ